MSRSKIAAVKNIDIGVGDINPRLLYLLTLVQLQSCELVDQLIGGLKAHEINRLTEFIESTDGHKYRGTDGIAGTGLMPYKAHSWKYHVVSGSTLLEI